MVRRYLRKEILALALSAVIISAIFVPFPSINAVQVTIDPATKDIQVDGNNKVGLTITAQNPATITFPNGQRNETIPDGIIRVTLDSGTVDEKIVTFDFMGNVITNTSGGIITGLTFSNITHGISHTIGTFGSGPYYGYGLIHHNVGTDTVGELGDGSTLSGISTNPYNEDTAGNYQIVFNPALLSTTSHTIRVDVLKTSGDTSGFTSGEIPFVNNPRQSVTLDESSGVRGDVVTLSGSHFSASSPITAAIDNHHGDIVTAPITTDGSGSFSGSITIPSDARQDADTVTITDGSSKSATAPFTVETPSITVNPTAGPTGTSVLVTGSNFHNGDTATFDINGHSGFDSTTVASGGFSKTVTIPSDATVDTDQITATDTSGNSAHTAFTVGTTTIALSPIGGSTGSSVHVTGSGFVGGSTVTITFGSSGTVATTTADGTGSIATDFTVPSVASGSYHVTASDGTNSATASFVVTTSITLSTSTGVSGTVVTVSGSGFIPHHSLTITYGTHTITTTTQNDGTIKPHVTFTVTGADVTGTVTATDTSNSATAPFTVPGSPAITLSASSGGGGDTVTVSGTNFIPLQKITIKFDSATVSNTVKSAADGSFSIPITIPANAAGGAHTIKASDGSNILSQPFTVVAGITLSPPSAPPGTLVTVSGTNFAPSSAHHSVTVTITYGSHIITTTTKSDGSLPTGHSAPTFFVSPTDVTGPVTASDGTNSATKTFTVSSASITLSPPSGVSGTSVTVIGTGFIASHSVTITYGTHSVTVTSKSDGTLPSTAKFTVTGADVTGTVTAFDGTNPAHATFTISGSPAITLSASSGGAGSTVTVSGTNFIPLQKITIKFDSAMVSSTTRSAADGSFSIPITIPATAHGGAHTITASDGSNTLSQPFTVGAGITLSPPSGPPGTLVTVSGTNFAPSSAHHSVTVTITYGLRTITTTTKSDGSLPTGHSAPTFTILNTDVTGPVTASDGTNSDTKTFTVTGAPSITLSPSAGPAGTSVTVIGTGFIASHPVTITYGTHHVTVTSKSDGTLPTTAKFPVTNTDVTGTVTANDGTNSATETFTVTTASITLGASSGSAGSTVTVSGSNFIASHSISIKFDSSTISSTTRSAADGSFFTTITIPATAVGGAHTIKASDNTNSPSQPFTVVAGITLSTSSGAPGTVVTVSGTNFVHSHLLTITYGGHTITVTTTRQGAIPARTTFTVLPADTTGTVSATDGTNTATAPFTVTTASITLSPTTGPQGTTVHVTGSGFAPKSMIHISFGGKDVTPSSHPTSTATGTISTSFQVPVSAIGSITVTVTDSNSPPNTATAPFFKLLPSIFLVPTHSGTAGNTLSIQGFHFIPSQKIKFTIDGETLDTFTPATTDASGNFLVSFSIPDADPSDYAITASDGTNHSFTTLTITP